MGAKSQLQLSSTTDHWVPRESRLRGSLDHTEARNNRFSVLDIPDAAECCRRAENEVGVPGVAQSALELKGEGAGERVHGWFPCRRESLVAVRNVERPSCRRLFRVRPIPSL